MRGCCQEGGRELTVSRQAQLNDGEDGRNGVGNSNKALHIDGGQMFVLGKRGVVAARNRSCGLPKLELEMVNWGGRV